MKIINKLFISTILVCASVNAFSASKDALESKQILSLQNLERERAALVHDMLDPSLDTQSRMQKLNKRQRHLTDMERMVMRDERLLSSNSVLVKNAFSQYSSTFLVHAGAEHNRSASEQWLSNVELSNAAILSSHVGFRK